MAISEFSYSELKEKSQNGDNYATQFIETFTPYENELDAKKINPEYIEYLRATLDKEKVYYYHCLKVTDENKCPIYENRPNICKDFPDNPLGFLPNSCNFNGWLKEIQDDILQIRAYKEIEQYYREQLKEN